MLKILPTLNPWHEILGIQDKNLADIYWGREGGLMFPETIVKNIKGVFLNKDMTVISDDNAIEKSLIEKSFIIKQSVETGGGKNVLKIIDAVNKSDIQDLFKKYKRDFIVQKIIEQHPDTAQFNPSSLNTFRITTLFLNGKFSVLARSLRFGAKGIALDNLSNGSFLVKIEPDGTCGNFMYNKLLDKQPISTRRISDYKKIEAVIQKYHLTLFPHLGILGWDLAIDKNSRIVCIEINTSVPGIFEWQPVCGPIFSDRTEEVIDYVKKHPAYKLACGGLRGEYIKMKLKHIIPTKLLLIAKYCFYHFLSRDVLACKTLLKEHHSQIKHIEKHLLRLIYDGLPSWKVEQFILSYINKDVQLIKTASVILGENDPISLCVVKDDLYRIKMQVEHHRKIGIKHFVYIDNMSQDGTYEWLLEQSDVSLYRAEKYLEIKKCAWIKQVMDIYGYHKWYLFVDSDELFAYPGYEHISIQKYIYFLKKNNIEFIMSPMIDMYSKEKIFGLDEKKIIDGIQEKYCWFDTSGSPRWRVFHLKNILKNRLLRNYITMNFLTRIQSCRTEKNPSTEHRLFCYIINFCRTILNDTPNLYQSELLALLQNISKC